MESTFLVHFHPASTQKNEYSVKNIWKSYIWTADKDVNESDPRSNVHYLGSSENKYGIWTHDLCDTGAALYQLS